MKQDIILRLKKSGHRITRARSAIIDVLLENSKPLSAPQIQKLLISYKVVVNKTTIYRELWFLKKQGIVQEIFFGEGKSRFEFISKDCHHHLICENCGDIQDIRFNEQGILQQLKRISKFKTQRHSMEFFGLCVHCQ